MNLDKDKSINMDRREYYNLQIRRSIDHLTTTTDIGHRTQYNNNQFEQTDRAENNVKRTDQEQNNVKRTDREQNNVNQSIRAN